MKRTLLVGAAVLMAFVVIFIGCDNPVTNPESLTTVKENASIGAPNVQAVVYPGAIVVGWDPVKDASGYVVYRRDDTTKVVERKTAVAVQGITGTESESLSYPDIISATNPLYDGRSYTYFVAATSGQSTSGRSVDTPINNGPQGDTEIVWEGQGSVTVTARLPADYTVPTIENLDAVKVFTYLTSGAVDVSATPTEQLKVTWKALEYNPAVNVRVVYSYGKTPVGFSVTPKAVSSGLASTLYSLVGGENTISVQAIFGDGSYYDTPDATTITETSALTLLPQVADFKATRAADDSNYVTLKWDLSELAAAGSAGYKVYRAQFTGTNTPDTDDGDAVYGNVSIVGDWAPVDISKVELITSTTTYKVTDPTVVLVDQNYVYAILAVNGTAKSSSPKLALVEDTTLVKPKGFGNFTVLDGPKVQISFANDGLTSYELSRALITFAPGVTPHEYTQPLTINDYENPIAKAAGDVPEGWVTYIDTPATRSYYRYKLVVVKNGLTATFYKNLVDAPYSDAVNLTGTVASSTKKYKAIDFKVTNGLSTLDTGTDLSVDIFRADSDGDGKEKTAFTKITTATFTAGLPEDSIIYTDADSVLKLGYTYVYRFEVRKGTATNVLQKSTARCAITTQDVKPSDAYTAFSNAVTSDPTSYVNGNSMAIIVSRNASNTAVNLLNGAQVYRALKTATTEAGLSTAKAVLETAVVSTISFQSAAPTSGTWAGKLQKGDYYFTITWPGTSTSFRQYLYTVYNENGEPNKSTSNANNYKVITVAISSSDTKYDNITPSQEDYDFSN